MPPRTLPEQLRMLARARSGGTFQAESVTLRALDLSVLGEKLGCWFMVDHAGLQKGKAKTVYAACDQRALEAVLRDL